MNRSISWTKVVALAVALVMVLSGCGATSGGKTSGAAQASAGGGQAGKAEGGNLTFALATSPDTLDPHRSGLAVAVRAIRTIYDNLVVQLPDGSIKPWLAKEWSVSKDGKSYTFKLREDVKFHDGTPFNAEAVKYNLDRVIDPATKAANSLALIRPYSSSEVIDEYTIKVNLNAPSQAFLGNLSQALLGIVSPTAAKKYGDQLGKNPVGTGPYTFVKWDGNADIVVAKNKDYNWGPETVENKGVPHIDTITFKIVPEEATRIGSVQSKQVLAAETVPPQNIAALKSDPNQQLLQANTVGLPYTLFFNLRKAPWDDVKVRQAVQSAVDVESIVKTLYLGNYERAWSALSPGILGYDKALEGSITPDINRANQLLEEQGWVKGADGIRVKDGKKLTLRYVDGSPNREKRNDIAAIIQQQLKPLGIAVEVVITKDIATVIYQNWDYDLYGNSQVNSDPNALYAFYHTSAEGERPTLSGLSEPKIDQLLEQGAVETDSAKRVDIYSQIQKYLIEQAVILPIYVFPYTVAASKNVEGIKFDALGYPLFNDVRIQP
ncbi:peptide/nickel transport system substrate-binding protein [Paenibacillus intestini]|uniref:ABC transporter substrate-binding protein n=1 Tax=Paenibacillus cucumis (ex Kampfer et al. 2016) TaxID=1776858 RepID=A0ABS7KQY5_9BACL|nr:ABC transporter substrate-binding protein [Paenibacillus cucumis (ex Kampfer et al. 2016)]MBY0206351.1 ABC transporter substrate-binding protein [Paenibacillus cucumis (ex Kampfer et al. 2016)]MDP9701191.1 peptide/nickel transport system substrate-binding protein [Paenibacillus intestini]